MYKGSPPKNEKFFWGKLSQIWFGGVADSQTGPKITKSPKFAFCDPNFTFRVPKSLKNPGVGGFKDLGKFSQKKRFFGGVLP